MEFADEDLDESLATEFWVNAQKTPHRVHGKGGMVHWRNCRKVTLVQVIQGQYKEVKACRTTGQGLLLKGHTLVFFGPGGEAKEA